LLCFKNCAATFPTDEVLGSPIAMRRIRDSLRGHESSRLGRGGSTPVIRTSDVAGEGACGALDDQPFRFELIDFVKERRQENVDWRALFDLFAEAL
jgi:hypothetical protein